MTASRPQATDRIANPTRILCPIDLSDFSRPALACAVALGGTFGADVTALHGFAAWLPPASGTTFPSRTISDASGNPIAGRSQRLAHWER